MCTSFQQISTNWFTFHSLPPPSGYGWLIWLKLDGRLNGEPSAVWSAWINKAWISNRVRNIPGNKSPTSFSSENPIKYGKALQGGKFITEEPLFTFETTTQRFLRGNPIWKGFPRLSAFPLKDDAGQRSSTWRRFFFFLEREVLLISVMEVPVDIYCWGRFGGWRFWFDAVLRGHAIKCSGQSIIEFIARMLEETCISASHFESMNQQFRKFKPQFRSP